MADRLEDLLRACTVRVLGGPMPGAGFFVAPGKVVTCFHVIGDSQALVVRWERDGQRPVEIAVVRRPFVLADKGRPIPALDRDYPDIAVLDIGAPDGHPCVAIDAEWPSPEDSFQVFGYPEEGGAVQLTPARLTYRGTHGAAPTMFLDLASDTIKPGMSGAAVLNLRSGAVCGVIVASKHPARPDGALAISWSAAEADLSGVLAANRAFHLQDRRWGTVVAERRWAGSSVAGGSAVPEAGHPPVPHQLPPDAAHFTGRGDELAELDGLLIGGMGNAATAVVITAIAGTAGVGKTALAVHWAHKVQDRFPDGVLYANLRGYDQASAPAEPGAIIDNFLRALYVPEALIRGDLEARTKLYRSQLRGRRVLVVLDNARTAEQVRPLLPGSPTCHVVVTSRDALPGLVALDGAHRITLNVLSVGKAVALLRQIIGAKHVNAELADTLTLARLCAYLPLALGIAAERAIARDQVSIADLIAELNDERARLNLLSTDDDPHAAVRAVFSWSYHALPPKAARMFRLLGLHRGLDISVPAASALSGTSHEDARLLLDALRRVHLLEERKRGRYEFHDLLRAYARERIEKEEANEDSWAATHRLLDWYLQTADAADRKLIPYHRHVPPGPLQPPTPPLVFASYNEAMNWCETERGNLVAATSHAAKIGEHLIAWKLPLALWSFFTLRRFWADWITTHDIGLASAQELKDRYAEAWILNNLGIYYRQLGHHQQALQHYHRALAIWHEIADQWGQARALNEFGETYQEMKQPEEALKYYQQALAIWQEIRDPWGEASTLTGLGNVYRMLRRFDNAVDYADQAIEVWRSINDQRGQGRALSQIGEAYQEQGKHQQAISHFQQALSIRRALGERSNEARTLYSLGDSLCRIGQIDSARETWTLAFAIFEELKSTLANEVRARLEALDRTATPNGQTR